MAHLFSDLRRGSRHERGYGSAWDKTRARIMMRDGGICQPCLKLGSVHPGTEVDHRTPKAQGGTDDDDNLQTICKDAHRAKTVVEALHARGLAAPRPSAACSASGLPTDPSHPWAQAGGGKIPAAPRLGTDPDPSLAKCQLTQGGVRR